MVILDDNEIIKNCKECRYYDDQFIKYCKKIGNTITGESDIDEKCVFEMYDDATQKSFLDTSKRKKANNEIIQFCNDCYHCRSIYYLKDGDDPDDMHVPEYWYCDKEEKDIIKYFSRTDVIKIPDFCKLETPLFLDTSTDKESEQ